MGGHKFPAAKYRKICSIFQESLLPKVRKIEIPLFSQYFFKNTIAKYFVFYFFNITPVLHRIYKNSEFYIDDVSLLYIMK